MAGILPCSVLSQALLAISEAAKEQAGRSFWFPGPVDGPRRECGTVHARTQSAGPAHTLSGRTGDEALAEVYERQSEAVSLGTTTSLIAWLKARPPRKTPWSRAKIPGVKPVVSSWEPSVADRTEVPSPEPRTGGGFARCGFPVFSPEHPAPPHLFPSSSSCLFPGPAPPPRPHENPECTCPGQDRG